MRSRMLESLTTAAEQGISRDFASDVCDPSKPLSPEVVLEARRSELRNGLTDMQRLFLFGKLSDLNDKVRRLQRVIRSTWPRTQNRESGSRASVQRLSGSSAVRRKGNRNDNAQEVKASYSNLTLPLRLHGYSTAMLDVI